MIQDIAPHVFNNQYRPQPPMAESYALCYENKTVLIRASDEGIFDLPTFRELATDNPTIYDHYTYLFSIDDRAFYWPGPNITAPHGFSPEAVRAVMRSRPRPLAFAAVTGYQLFNWYESRKYCGRCGAWSVQDEKTRSLSCPICGQVEFPKIAPAVIVGVRNGNSLLLAEYPHYDRYALIAGFAEIGETLEETVEREVMEEAGLKVKNIRYYKSQPWALADNLLMGFFCDLDGADKIVIDEDELANADWVAREDIPGGDDDYLDGSLTSEMIDHFRRNGV